MSLPVRPTRSAADRTETAGRFSGMIRSAQPCTTGSLSAEEGECGLVAKCGDRAAARRLGREIGAIDSLSTVNSDNETLPSLGPTVVRSDGLRRDQGGSDEKIHGAVHGFWG